MCVSEKVNLPKNRLNSLKKRLPSGYTCPFHPDLLMPTSAQNMLVICSDQHHPRMSGYRGHPYVQTPNLDRLAESGTHFTSAYCTSPVCTPSRMSFITGKYVHQIETWMIGFPLARDEMTWARRLDQAGIPTTMLGKMDLCGGYQDGGFTDHRIIHHRKAWPEIPRPEPWPDRMRGFTRPDKPRLIREAGPRPIASQVDISGQYDSYDHDRQVTDWALDYLQDRAGKPEGEPWCVYVGYLLPHWPFRIPDQYFDMYYPDHLDLPFDAHFPNESLHPAIRHFQEALDLGAVDEDIIRRTVAAYYGMITCLDDQVGELMAALDRHSLTEQTTIIYTSDHGESLGEHGLFYKQCAYEGSVGVPLILSGPEIPAGKTVAQPVDLVDLYPTILDWADLEPEADRPGNSWLPLTRGAVPRRPYAFSEFHGNFFRHDWYMLVRGDFKYVYYAKERPSLFNIVDDPNEMTDLAMDPSYEGVLKSFEATLRTICDPDDVANQAKRDLGLIGPDGTDYTN